MSHTTDQAIDYMNSQQNLSPKLADMLRTQKGKNIGTAFDEADMETIPDLVKKINTCGSCKRNYFQHARDGFMRYRCTGCGCPVHERIEDKGCPAGYF